MQNRYVGDIGDFVKYGLLNFLLENQPDKANIKLGINWYLVPNEKNSKDGKYTKYLESTNRFANSLQECNRTLYHRLRVIVNKQRDVKEVERGKVLPRGTLFYNKLIQEKRKSWHSEALKELESTDIIFLDPDNGIQTNRMALMTSTGGKAHKYVLDHEIADYYKRGQSVIVYTHRSRQKESLYKERFERVKKKISKHTTIYLLRANRYTTRDFIILIQPKHRQFLEERISDFRDSDWMKMKHFSKVEPL